ncbi:MAG: hypothetical protein COB66_00800, partial [Coxiella sp. (in: Bacteria)]
VNIGKKISAATAVEMPPHLKQFQERALDESVKTELSIQAFTPQQLDEDLDDTWAHLEDLKQRVLQKTDFKDLKSSFQDCRSKVSEAEFADACDGFSDACDKLFKVLFNTASKSKIFGDIRKNYTLAKEQLVKLNELHNSMDGAGIKKYKTDIDALADLLVTIIDKGDFTDLPEVAGNIETLGSQARGATHCGRQRRDQNIGEQNNASFFGGHNGSQGQEFKKQLPEEVLSILSHMRI